MIKDKIRLKAPLLVQFEITPACNNNCRFCYNFWEHDGKSSLSRKSPIREEKTKQLFDILLKHEVPAICFTGGEPFLAGKMLFELVDNANQIGLYTSINTNGRLINNQNAKQLKRLELKSILVSLHGDSKQIHETAVGCEKAFSETLTGINNLINAGLNITVNYVSTSKNVDKIIPTSRMLKDMGVKNMTITPLLPFPGVKNHKSWAMKKEQFRKFFDSLVFAKENGLNIDSTLPVAPCILRDMFPKYYEKYLGVLSPRVCMAGVTFMAVSPEGFNRACIQAPQLEKYGGDISRNFESAWRNAYIWSKSDLLPQECLNCFALSSCGGGCRTSSLAKNNSTSGKTMYMGESIPRKEAKPFIDRLEVKVNTNVISFKKRKDIKFREEKFGGILANTSRQSFVVLDKKGVEAYDSMPNNFSVNSKDRGIYVLYAAGVIEAIQDDNFPKFNKNIFIIHASQLFPRLAGTLPLDNKVRMLRADTGEKIYF